MNSQSAILTALKILAVAALVLMNALFVAAELAMVRIRDSQLAPLVAKGNRRAKTARHILAHIDVYIGATQFGITLASLLMGMTVEPVFHSLLEPIFKLTGVASETVKHNVALGVGFFTNCYLLIVAGELVPKAVAIRRTLPAALVTARPLIWFYRISFPFIWLLNRLGPGFEMARDFGGRTSRRAIRGGTACHSRSRARFARPAQPDFERHGPAPPHGA